MKSFTARLCLPKMSSGANASKITTKGAAIWKNSLVPICTKFISAAVASPTITGGSLSGNNASIKVKRLFAGCPLYRSTSKLNGIFAQHGSTPREGPLRESRGPSQSSLTADSVAVLFPFQISCPDSVLKSLTVPVSCEFAGGVSATPNGVKVSTAGIWSADHR